MNNLLDTFQNLVVFVFIGAMLWLYFKKEPDDHKQGDTPEEKHNIDLTPH